ncbi:cyclic nucleotide-dependent protein kinase [Holotrichia oblita]|uniref:Cyclic nucleotide-dependent protein kinase n=1 Tax=Holotrichia oblita TaxID=644536 RepID=A0ACB9TDZ0_HOLOL|nr:cyclic nucleotide-dependent protein kinase [Holotrichia oblita]
MVQQDQVEHVFNEKDIQINCNSNFIVRLYKTFQDSKYLYFLMESCLGGDLWTYLQKRKGRMVPEIHARFYAACVLEAIAYLHERNYIYRDLKPENLLIDARGYIKLTDFGFAKSLKTASKTYTFAGTPEYVAPEIIYNRGHDKSIDYWAFGILIFELLVGKSPFRTDDHTNMMTYNRILRGITSITFPPHVTKSATNLIKSLCRPLPTDRLGNQKNGIQDIRIQNFFQGFDWEKLRNQSMKPPFVPKLSGYTDTKYFEKFSEDDDIPPQDETTTFEGF